MISFVSRNRLRAQVGLLVKHFVLFRNVDISEIIGTQGMMDHSLNLQDAQALIRRRQFHTYIISPIMKIKVFHENDAVQYVELESKSS